MMNTTASMPVHICSDMRIIPSSIEESEFIVADETVIARNFETLYVVRDHHIIILYFPVSLNWRDTLGKTI